MCVCATNETILVFIFGLLNADFNADEGNKHFTIQI